jgi:LCP family protein required for cell wall assembly
MSKINATFNKSDPTRLIATIESFFHIPVDHYVSIDFCVFKDLVNAVGGIKIPFATALRDHNTRLNVPAGCYKFDGDHALAYVRSRHMQYQSASGAWKSEGTADIGRIKRQQDFIRRVMNSVRSKGALNLGLVTKLVNSFEKRVVVDSNLTATDVLQLAGALKGFDPANTRSFIVEGRITNKGPESVVDPQLSTSRMRTILAAFRGQTYLKNIPQTNQANVYGTKSITPDNTVKC